jgi:hypothetical protein
VVLAATLPCKLEATPARSSAIAASGRGAPWLALGDGVAVPTVFEGPDGVVRSLGASRARPLAMVSDDFDEDGVRDLAVGYGDGADGIVTLFRGDVAAIHPNSPEARETSSGSPFLSPARAFALPGPADLLGAGDFDNDGHRDLVAASRGGECLMLLGGDGRGDFAPARDERVPGRVTALASGEMNRTDGLADLVVAVDGAEGSRVLVFEGPDGALKARPEVIPVPATVSSLGLGHLAGTTLGDLAVAAERDLLVVRGRDRRLVAGDWDAADVPAPTVDRRAFEEPIASLAVGDFAGDHRADVAVLFSGGSARVLARSGDAGFEEIAMSDVRSVGATSLIAARISSAPYDVPVVLDAARRELLALGAGGQVALAVDREPAAALAMRLNGDALDDLVLMRSGASAPVVSLTSPRAVFTVTTAADAGAGSLRQAILDANASPGADEIRFAIGSGPQTIRVESSLPEIADPATIDGTTQPGYEGVPLVELNGGLVPGRDGLVVSAGNSVIRGLVVNRFRQSAADEEGRGIALRVNGGNRIEGNVVGTDAAGTTDISNYLGVSIEGASAENVVGDTVPAGRNVICGVYRGVIVRDGATDNRIRGNYVGVDPTATFTIASNIAVEILDVPRNEVGGTDAGAANVVGGASDYGVDIYSDEAAENLVQGNFIGTDPTGTRQLHSFAGVGICGGGEDGADANFIGGTAVGAGNTIAYNEFGVVIGVAPDTDAVENRVLGNSIFGSLHVSIDLAMNNASFNDPGDEDLGPNVQQNSPVLTAAAVDGDTALVDGSLDSTPNASFRVEFFSGSGFGQEGFGEGGRFLGFVNVTTDATGHADIAVALPASTLAGEVITATATSGSGNTSETSLSVAIGVSWDAPDAGSGAQNPPPRRVIARIPDTGGKLPGVPLRGTGALLGYNVYRGDHPDFEPGPDTLLRERVEEQAITTFVFPRGAFFKVTAVYTTGESEPAPVAFAGGVAEVTSATATKSKITVDGSGFTDAVEVFVDGWGQRTPARVKRGNTRVVQKNAAAGETPLKRYLRERGTVNVLVRNDNGGLAIARIGR